jgi:RNA polymerase sigma-70 factor (ECF subfamily)
LSEFNNKPAVKPSAHPFEREIGDLWTQAQSGDELAYAQMLQLCAQRLRSFFKRRMNNTPEDIEDMVQETLLAVHTRRHTYDSTFPVSAWVMAIAKYKLIDFWRRHERRDRLHDEFDETLMAQTTQQPSLGGNESNVADVDTLLSQLPEKQRQAITLIKLLGLSAAEAAQQTGQSESALKVQVHRGIKQLSQLIKRRPS